MEDVESSPLVPKPNEDGSILRKGSVLATSICLCKAAIGAGVLSIAAHCAEVGFAFTLGALTIGGVLTVVSIRMIGEASIATGCWSFEDICEELFHPALSIVTGLVQSCNCLGAAAAYLIICGQIFQVITGASPEWFARFIVISGTCICLPLALAPHVNFLRYVSVLSVSGLIFLVLAVAYILSQHGRDSTVEGTSTVLHGDGHASVFVYMNCLNLVVFAYNNQFNVPQLTGELQPRGGEQVAQVASTSTVSVFFLYSSVSLLGLLAFGVGDNQKETLVLDLRHHARNPVVVAALLMVMFSTLMCFEFHIYPIRQFLAYTFRKLRGRARCALSAVSFSIYLAVSLESVKSILDFIGAFAAAYTSFVVPPLWILKLRSRQSAGSAHFAMYDAPVLCWTVFAIGLFFFFFGTYAAIVA